MVDIQEFIYASKPILTSCLLKDVEAVLSKQQFLRIHKSFLVNIKTISKIERGNRIYLDDNTILPIAKRRKTAFWHNFFGQ